MSTMRVPNPRPAGSSPLTDSAALIAGRQPPGATPEHQAGNVTGLVGVPVRLDPIDRSPDAGVRTEPGSEAELVERLLAERRAHADNERTGRCPRCGVSTCLGWRYANSLLAMCGDD